MKRLAAGWNWKSAVSSSLCRSAVFFAANLPAGLGAATTAWMVELVYRGIASGFYGALTERFSRWPSKRAGTLAAMVILPALAHSIELVVHRTAGTPEAGRSVLMSIAFTLITTRVNLFAMRRGLLVVGEGRQSLCADMRVLFRLIVRRADRVSVRPDSRTRLRSALRTEP